MLEAALIHPSILGTSLNLELSSVDKGECRSLEQSLRSHTEAGLNLI